MSVRDVYGWFPGMPFYGPVRGLINDLVDCDFDPLRVAALVHPMHGRAMKIVTALHDEHRAALTRALTAQAWAEMIRWAEFFRLNFPHYLARPAWEPADGTFPAPADVAAEMLA